MSEYQVTWQGFVHDDTGYARASREYLLALHRAGVDVRVVPLAYSNMPLPAMTNKEQESIILELAQKPLATNKKKVLIHHSQPFGINVEKERETYDYVIINTVWETTRIPDDWVSNSKKVDGIFLPSNQNIKAFENSGLYNTYLVPHGADIERYSPDNKGLPFTDINGKFVFLSVFGWQHRKGPEILLKAFWEEFKKDDNVTLIVKTSAGQSRKEDERNLINQIAGFKQFLGYDNNTAPIYLVTSRTDDEQIRGLYGMSDVFVLPTRGEGVGLPFIEALSSGVPVITTGWGGQTDFLNEGNSLSVGYDLQDPTLKMNEAISPTFSNLFTSNMEWAEPKIGHLRHQMRYAYNHKAEMKEKGLAGRKDMEQMTWDKSAEAMIEAIKTIIK